MHAGARIRELIEFIAIQIDAPYGGIFGPARGVVPLYSIRRLQAVVAQLHRHEGGHVWDNGLKLFPRRERCIQLELFEPLEGGDTEMLRWSETVLAAYVTLDVYPRPLTGSD